VAEPHALYGNFPQFGDGEGYHARQKALRDELRRIDRQ